MSAIKEPGPCPFCAWDHPSDPPHSRSCCIGPHVEFAFSQGVAEERARVVAWLRSPDHLLGTPPTTRDLYIAGAIERGKHEEVK